MLILIAGITGNLGQHLAHAALSAGHTVRGLGRTPTRLPASISDKLESFVQTASHADIPALDRGCSGADAIVCAYGPLPELALDGQLLLLRAAERAGIKRFHAASWNLDWRDLPLGKLETYDPYIAFMYQARLTSAIKPLYAFIGVLADTFFAVPGAGHLEDEQRGFWVTKPDSRRINAYGSGEEKFDWTTEADAAAFSIALVTSDEAEKGGFWSFRSQAFSLKELKETYEKVRGTEVKWDPNMGPDVMEGIISQMRGEALEKGALRESWYSYIGLVYAMYMIRGDMNMRKTDNEKFPEVKPTSLEEYFKIKPEL
ncbi:NAD(P)-binding protein [Aulographum hederae CBS 113979]|uniref:NAD(P)-binding protein n=1 Tax=Aulographum hederae CBS 113979 TaxID=1176131 RepID=A0A6G1GVB3_9PEZI|nr:NAD(P)-binding protein [Aulographum hederae CBS 113979]